MPLCKRLRLSTPGVLGSDTSSVVSRPHCLLRPHPPVPRARGNFTALPVICRAFAVRERLGDPRDLPYFRCRALQACRRPYAGGFKVLSRYACAPRYQASSLCPRVATRKCPPLPAIFGGEYFSTRHRSLHAAARLFAKTSWLAPTRWRHVSATGHSAVFCHSRLARGPSPTRAGSQAKWANGKSPVVGTCTRPVTCS